jgi:hypothetical protein
MEKKVFTDQIESGRKAVELLHKCHKMVRWGDAFDDRSGIYSMESMGGWWLVLFDDCG